MARYYQSKINEDSLPDSFVATKSGAHEYNSVRDELTGTVTASALVPSPFDVDPGGGTDEDRTQLAQAVFVAAIGSQSFGDGGTSSAYDLTPIGPFKMPPAGTDPGEGYTVLGGAMVSFVANSTNIASPTLTIGPVGGPTYGAKPIKTDDIIPVAIPANQIFAGRRYQVYYDSGADAWILVQAYASTRTLSTVIYYAQPSTVVGGSLSGAATWDPVKLNTIHLNEIGLTIDTVGYTFTLPPGRYNVEAMAILDEAKIGKLRIWNTTTLAAISYSLNGAGENSYGPYTNNPYIWLRDKLIINATAVCKLEIRGTGPGSEPTSLGSPANIPSVNEIYTILKIDRDF